jgi:nucleoside-diphosphate-sugar epimerase
VQQDSSGAHVLTDLYKDGHNVTALVRNDDQADIVAARGATPTVFDLYDRAAVVSVLGDADGAIHTASPGDATSADLDSAVVDAAIDACAGTGKPFIEISSQWVHGANTSITEESLFQAPALVAWKEPIERRVLGAKDMRDVVVVSGVVYGDGGGGMPGLLLGSPRDDQGNLIMLGTGQQHWSTVHVADLADFFRRVLEHDAARGYYVVGDGLNPTVAEFAETAAVAAGAPGAVPGSDEVTASLRAMHQSWSSNRFPTPAVAVMRRLASPVSVGAYRAMSRGGRPVVPRSARKRRKTGSWSQGCGRAAISRRWRGLLVDWGGGRVDRRPGPPYGAQDRPAARRLLAGAR